MSYGWAPYVPVAKRRAIAKKKMDKLRKKGVNIQPIEKTGNKITKTFWGNSWCSHLENFSDYDNRLPRGRTYVRNGSVCHLDIKKGQINAMVSGSEIYNITVQIKPLSKNIWQTVKKKCVGRVGSLLELLQGKLSDNVMKTVTDPNDGLFPKASEIKMKCDCPDWADMCKHLAAVLYGIGVRLDHSPELLFVLRDVDHTDLITSEVKIPTSSRRKPKVSGDLADIFGIDLVSPKPSEDSKEQKIKAKKKSVAVSRSVTKVKSKQKSTLFQKEKIDISRGIRASHVEKLRKALNMTEADFAHLLNRKVATVSNWKNKKGLLRLQFPSREALVKAFADYNNEL